MTTKPHEQRVIAERADLDEKLTKLEAFLSTETFGNLDQADGALLTRQAKIMTDYVLVLDARIDRFSASAVTK